MRCEIIYDSHQLNSTWEDDIDKPTIVFDAGMGNWSLFFQPLVNELRAFARVCLIDRDGYLEVDSGRPKDIITVACQMKEVLELNKVHEPIILVGHSLGGLHVRIFQHLFPEKVAGLVLLDAAHPRLYDVLPHIRSNLQKQIRLVEILKVLAWLKILKFARRNIPTFGLPSSLHENYYGVTTRARYYATYQAEMKHFESNLDMCKSLDSLGDLPLLVMSSPYGLNNPFNERDKLKDMEDDAWMSLQKDLANLSSQSIFTRSKGDHFLHLTDTVVVASAIQNFYKDVVRSLKKVYD